MVQKNDLLNNYALYKKNGKDVYLNDNHFDIPNNLYEQIKNNCPICQDPLYTRSFVYLPSCQNCNQKSSCILHANCAKEFFQLHKPFHFRQTNHLICGKKYENIQNNSSYYLPVSDMIDLDLMEKNTKNYSFKPFTCDCGFRIKNRISEILHYYRGSMKSILSSDEKVQIQNTLDDYTKLIYNDNPQLLNCPLSFHSCKYCKCVFPWLELKSHGEICKNLSDDTRKQFKKMFMNQRNAKYEQQKIYILELERY